jgi:uncharacterized protein (DUF362 family)
MPLPSPVVVCRTAPGRVRTDLERTVVLADFARLEPARRTLVKFNGNVRRYYPGSNTSRWFLDALLGLLRDRGFADVALIEGNLPQFTVEEMLRNTALDRVLARHAVRCINYEHLPRRDRLPALLDGAQVINTPVVHTHGFAVVSCATKNLFGLLPVDRYRYHPVLSETLLELAARVPTFTIVDATVSMHGDSTRTGTPFRTDLLAAGSDNLAIDVVAARLLGFDAADVPLLALARERGLVAEHADVRGDFTWDALPNFAVPFRRGVARRATMWLEGLSTDGIVPRLTGHLLHRTLFPAYAAAVGLYVELSYLRKRRALRSGPWMDYELPDGAIARA